MNDRDYKDYRNITALGYAIRKARGKVTQLRIAKLTGVTNVYVSYVEAGRRCPSLRWLIKFCNEVGVELADLFRRADVIAEGNPDEE